MGKKKNIDMAIDPNEESVAKPKKTSQKMTIWEDLYQDLNPRVGEALRNARVKPEQLVTMSDGEITAIAGIGEEGLEEIRAKYAPDAIMEELKQHDVPQEDLTKTATPRKPRHPNRGGKKIRAMKSKVDRTKLYEVIEAVKLVKQTNITSFDSTITLHLNLKEKISKVEVTYPFAAGAKKKIAIADDVLLKEIEKGILNFDILLTTPAMMPKLAKYARILGPKGLMPSPKAGTVTTDPEARRKEFEGGKTMVKAEAKYPLLHAVIGKTSQKEEELTANIKALLAAVKLSKIDKAVLAATMSPGVKLLLQ